MRLVYLDEAGVSQHEPTLCVAGVLIHGDYQSQLVEEYLEALVERYIPEANRVGFVFHAKDLYHGSGYFLRERWPREIRTQILFDLAGIITVLKLPVVAGFYHKDKFGLGIVPEFPSDNEKRTMIQTVAAMDCVIWTDRWLEKFSPTENALIIAEDTDSVKRLMKETIRVLRSPALIRKYGLEGAKDAFGLPLKRIVDTVHFSPKADARALQLADLCVFILARSLREKEIPIPLFAVIWDHLKWITPIATAKGALLPSELPDFSYEQPS